MVKNKIVVRGVTNRLRSVWRGPFAASLRRYLHPSSGTSTLQWHRFTYAKACVRCKTNIESTRAVLGVGLE